ncbi:hypothetical protein J6590_018704 [Homalodisca vitripennis]|nr:hypothetical protein J6590_018704 [Homalodisca vitripennis]
MTPGLGPADPVLPLITTTKVIRPNERKVPIEVASLRETSACVARLCPLSYRRASVSGCPRTTAPALARADALH